MISSGAAFWRDSLLLLQRLSLSLSLSPELDNPRRISQSHEEEAESNG